jgi:trehalose 6-phosphate synthase
VIARVDRIEPSKNILRGFAAFEELLATRPEWRGRVVFAAAVYPSRQALREYRSYHEQLLADVAAINDRWGDADWTPIVLDDDDDYPRSIALLRRYDVLLVNPVRDGLNLVAKEGPLVNERSGVVVLSTEAGAHDELGPAVLSISPFDVSATADALDAALRLPLARRAERAARLSQLAGARSPKHWLGDQLAAAD